MSPQHGVIACISVLDKYQEGSHDNKHVGLPPPVCIDVHAVFAGEAYAELRAACTERFVTCNSIAHPSNAIDLTDFLGDGTQAMLEEYVDA